MKKSCLLLITCILTATLAFGQNGPINYKIDNHVSLKLPSQPQTIDASNVMATDSNHLAYVVGLVDLVKTDGTDSAKLASIATTPEYIKLFRDNLVGAMPGFVMGDVKLGTWQNHTSYTLEGTYTRTNAKVYMFLFIIGSNLYSITALVPENQSPKGKDDLLASIVAN